MMRQQMMEIGELINASLYRGYHADDHNNAKA
jgi:hypothetical protein